MELNSRFTQNVSITFKKKNEFETEGNVQTKLKNTLTFLASQKFLYINVFWLKNIIMVLATVAARNKTARKNIDSTTKKQK